LFSSFGRGLTENINQIKQLAQTINRNVKVSDKSYIAVEDSEYLHNEVQIQHQERDEARNNIYLEMYDAPSIVISLHIIYLIEINEI